MHLADNDRKTLDMPGSSRSSKHLIFGDGELKLERIIPTLVQIGYEGWIQIDMWEHPEPLRCVGVCAETGVQDRFLRGVRDEELWMILSGRGLAALQPV